MATSRNTDPRSRKTPGKSDVRKPHARTEEAVTEPPFGPVVTIFGAGIAGLSAAHELVERGFLVQVVEPRESILDEGCCDVGGVAATQWSFLSDPSLRYGHASKLMSTPPGGGVTAASTGFFPLTPAPSLPYRIYFRLWQNPQQEWRPSRYNKKLTLGKLLSKAPVGVERVENMSNARRIRFLAREIDAFLKAVPKQSSGNRVPKLHIVGHTERTATEASSRAWSRRWARQVAAALRDTLEAAPYNRRPLTDHVQLKTLGMGSVVPAGDNAFRDGRARNNRVELHMAGVHVPGDHGYRFFPSFYRNLDDTMERTPLYDANGDETGQSALSRLKPASEVSIATADGGEPLRLPRRRTRSFEELRTLTKQMMEKFGYPAKDIALFQLQLFRFLTMCPERRTADLDGLSWYDYIRGAESTHEQSPVGDCARCGRPVCHHHVLPFSEHFLRDIDKLPQAMAGMRAAESDAHTNGTITLQLLMDQLRDGNHADRLLDGPTSSSWLAHWKKYLRHQGVRFFLGKLQGFKGEHRADGFVLQPVAVGTRHGRRLVVKGSEVPPVAEPNFTDEVATQRITRSSDSYSYLPTADFYLAALPVSRLQRLLRKSVPPLPAPLPPLLQSIMEFPTGDGFAYHRAGPARSGPFRDVSGLQLYFTNDFHLAQGHVYHADSAWRLTSVSQMQFWRHRRTTSSGYLGVLAVDIGEMHVGDTSQSTWSSLALGRIAETLAARVRETGDAGLDELLDRVRSTHRHAQALASEVQRYVAGLPSSGRGGDEPWEVTALLADGITTAMNAGASSVESTLTGIIAGLEAPSPGTPASRHCNELKRCVDRAGAAAPTPLHDEHPLWKTWAVLLGDLDRIVDSLRAPGIALQATHASAALAAAMECLRSPADIPFAWQSTAEGIARSVWRQIRVALDVRVREKFPYPVYFRIDDGIAFAARKQSRRGPTLDLPIRNRNPYLINGVGEFQSRPGVLPGRKSSTEPFYELAYGQWLPVGGVMKTHTRITSMEHANESGRHAVRAILHALESRPGGIQYGTMPKYWNPEEHEFEELDFLRRIDSILHEDKRPHMVDILGLEEAVVRWMAGPGAESTDNLGGLLSAVRYQGNKDFSPWIEAMDKTSEPVRKLLEYLARIGMQSSVK